MIPGRHPDHQVWVGWDPPLRTYFAQVFGPPDDEGEGHIIFWIGAASFGEVPTLTLLASQLMAHAGLSEEMQMLLAADRLLDRSDSDAVRAANLRAAQELIAQRGMINRATLALEQATAAAPFPPA
jgi:hypothetical protein